MANFLEVLDWNKYAYLTKNHLLNFKIWNTLIDDVFKARFQTVLALVTSEKENIQCNVFKNPKESQKWIKNAEIVPVALK